MSQKQKYDLVDSVVKTVVGTGYEMTQEEARARNAKAAQGGNPNRFVPSGSKMSRSSNVIDW